MPTAIKVENLSKIYRLGEIGTGTLSKDLDRWFTMKVLGKEDPFLKIGQTNDRTTKSKSDVVYSLQDINVEIAQGDAVGIIGRNGAGKSTLLKILSRVTAPTTGRINVKGRVASLLEVGTGFHPELTGRENIYLNGAILGMRKKEIARKLDEIIDFSGVERYIDTPVKRYSSGMYVRLAFAVAAHLESEILIVDEVLAVGDAEFQKKCLGKMGEVSKGDGRTILFVSHNMGAIKNLCDKGILLNNGKILIDDEIENVLNKYVISQQNTISSLDMVSFRGPLNDVVKFEMTLVNGKNPFKQLIQISPQEQIIFDVNGFCKVQKKIKLTLSVFKDDIRLFTIFDSGVFEKLEGEFHSAFTLPELLLQPGYYTLGLGGFTEVDDWIWNESVFHFEVLEIFDSLYDKKNYGEIFVQNICKTKRVLK